MHPPQDDQGGQNGKPQKKPVKITAGSRQSVAGNVYRVSVVAGAGSGRVVFTKAKNAGSVAVPAVIRLADGKAYKVTMIAAGAFKGRATRTATIGANVAKICPKAFSGSRVIKLIVKTRLLTKKSVKGSLKGSKVKRVKVKVGNKKINKKYVKKYKKIFTKKNAGKSIKVK